MTQNASPPAVQPIIQADSTDAVWEWHVPSDKLCFSAGAKLLLCFGQSVPDHMRAFVAQCPDDKKDVLRRSLGMFLAGSKGAHHEVCFHTATLQARTQLVTLAHDAEGRAERVIGCVKAVERQPEAVFTSAKFSLQPPAPFHTTQDRARLLLALNAAGDGLWDWDANTNSVYYSPRYIEMLGYTPEEFPADLRTWEEKIHPEDYAHVVPMQKNIIATPNYGDTFECTYRMRRADGTWAWILGRGHVTKRDAAGKATRVVGLHTDISASQADRAHLEDLVRNDPLTGLRSRTFLKMMVDRLELNQVRPVGALVADINGLKMINDYLGHDEGNALLCEAALLLRGGVDATACVARMSGDEYAVLLPECGPRRTKEIMRGLQQTIEKHNAIDGRIPVLLAMGAACAETMLTGINETILEADKAMLRHKLQTRAKTRQHIRTWIETRTSTKIMLDDPRYF